MYSVRFSEDTTPGSPLTKLVASLADLNTRLESRRKVEPALFSDAMKLREDTHHQGTSANQC